MSSSSSKLQDGKTQTKATATDDQTSRRTTYNKTFRLKGIPMPWSLPMLQSWLQATFGAAATTTELQAGGLDLCATGSDYKATSVDETISTIVDSLATDVDGKTKTATVAFLSTPAELSNGSHEWFFPATTFHRPNALGRVDDTIRIDDTFHGLTVLKSVDTTVLQTGRANRNRDLLSSRSLQTVQEQHSLDIIAVSGLGGHAFGSFKQSGETHMWLRDSLPSDLPETRVMIYGYDTTLEGSQTSQSFEELASAFRLSLRTARRNFSEIPLVILGHSLGGIIVKEALNQMLDGEDEKDVLASIFGLILFGVPSEGMDTESLFPLVIGQPNLGLLNALGRESPLLREQRRRFYEVMKRQELELFCFYETKLSPTATKKTGKWKMDGPDALLVGSSSATRGAIDDPLHVQGLNRDHSHLVKFSIYEPEYEIVLVVLKRFFDKARERRNLPLTLEEQNCLKTLSFEHMDRRLKSVDQCLDGTCHWLCERWDYRSWLESEDPARSLLWIKGKPGSGKSTLLKHAIACIEERSVTRSNFVRMGIAPFFFNARGSEMEQNPLGLFRSLVHRLFQSIPPVRREVMKRYQHKKETTVSWTWYLSELMDILKCVTTLDRNYDVTIVIDAFDECQDDHQVTSHDLVAYFGHLASMVTSDTARLRICLSSRHFPSFKSGGFRQILVQDNNKDDIAKYMTEKLGEEFTHELDTKFMLDEKASGVFMWVVLMVSRLSIAQSSGMTHRSIRKFVGDLPRELNEVYKQQLQSVKYVDEDQAVIIVSWILFAMRPLTLAELRCILAFCFEPPYESIEAWADSEDFIEDEKQMLDQLRAFSGGLLEVRGGESVESLEEARIQFIHESAREFFLRHNGLSRFGHARNLIPGEVQNNLKDACLRYLNCRELGNSKWLLEDRLDLERFGFLSYACEHTVAHAARAEQSGIFQKALFDETCGLGDPYYLWTLTIDSLGQVTMQGSLKAIIASQARIIAILGTARKACVTTYDRAIPENSPKSKKRKRSPEQENIHLTFLKMKLWGTIDDTDSVSTDSEATASVNEVEENEDILQTIAAGLEVQHADVRSDPKLVASGLDIALPPCRYSLAGRLTESIKGIGISLVVSVPEGEEEEQEPDATETKH